MDNSSDHLIKKFSEDNLKGQRKIFDAAMEECAKKPTLIEQLEYLELVLKELKNLRTWYVMEGYLGRLLTNEIEYKEKQLKRCREPIPANNLYQIVEKKEEPMNKRDVFLCHASEDKEAVVKPLYKALTAANITCWLDAAEIQWGDSITKKVNDGLAESLYVIVVISESFLSKNWPQRELFAVLNQEASSGQVKILPILVGTNAILQKLPLLNDKLYLSWNDNPQPIVEALSKRLGKFD